jgi:hypothetical protein
VIGPEDLTRETDREERHLVVTRLSRMFPTATMGTVASQGGALPTRTLTNASRSGRPTVDPKRRRVG